LKASLDIIRPGGQITKVGWGPQPLVLAGSFGPESGNLARIVQPHLSHLEAVLALLANGVMNLDPIIGAVEPLENWQQAFDAMHDRKVIKAV